MDQILIYYHETGWLRALFKAPAKFLGAPAGELPEITLTLGSSNKLQADIPQYAWLGGPDRQKTHINFDISESGEITAYGGIERILFGMFDGTKADKQSMVGVYRGEDNKSGNFVARYEKKNKFDKIEFKFSGDLTRTLDANLQVSTDETEITAFGEIDDELVANSYLNNTDETMPVKITGWQAGASVGNIYQTKIYPKHKQVIIEGGLTDIDNLSTDQLTKSKTVVNSDGSLCMNWGQKYYQGHLSHLAANADLRFVYDKECADQNCTKNCARPNPDSTNDSLVIDTKSLHTLDGGSTTVYARVHGDIFIGVAGNSDYVIGADKHKQEYFMFGKLTTLGATQPLLKESLENFESQTPQAHSFSLGERPQFLSGNYILEITEMIQVFDRLDSAKAKAQYAQKSKARCEEFQVTENASCGEANNYKYCPMGLNCNEFWECQESGVGNFKYSWANIPDECKYPDPDIPEDPIERIKIKFAGRVTANGGTNWYSVKDCTISEQGHIKLDSHRNNLPGRQPDEQATLFWSDGYHPSGRWPLDPSLEKLMVQDYDQLYPFMSIGNLFATAENLEMHFYGLKLVMNFPKHLQMSEKLALQNFGDVYLGFMNYSFTSDITDWI